MLSLSFTAEGFFGCCIGGSKENEFGVVEETTAQALSPTASPTDMAAKSKRDTFIQLETTLNRAACARAVKGMIALEMRFLGQSRFEDATTRVRETPLWLSSARFVVRELMVSSSEPGARIRSRTPADFDAKPMIVQGSSTGCAQSLGAGSYDCEA